MRTTEPTCRELSLGLLLGAALLKLLRISSRASLDCVVFYSAQGRPLWCSGPGTEACLEWKSRCFLRVGSA